MQWLPLSVKFVHKANAIWTNQTSLGRSIQELTNDNYSEIKLYSIFHIEYKAIEFSTTVEPLLYDHPQNHIGVVV